MALASHTDMDSAVAAAIRLIDDREFGNGERCFTESGSVAREFVMPTFK
ncbi:hypothetical protein [Pistricoccus aurantiacus]